MGSPVQMRWRLGLSLVHRWNPGQEELDLVKPTRKRPLPLDASSSLGNSPWPMFELPTLNKVSLQGSGGW